MLRRYLGSVAEASGAWPGTHGRVGALSLGRTSTWRQPMTVTASNDIRVEHSRKRVRILLAGELVADTTAPLLVWEVPYYPTYYIPDGDVVAKLVPAGGASDPRLGEAELFTVQVSGGTAADRAARKYSASPARQLHNAVRFDWDAMSEWLEE